MAVKRKIPASNLPPVPAAANEIPAATSVMPEPVTLKPSGKILFVACCAAALVFACATAVLAVKNYQLSKQLSASKSQLTSQGQNPAGSGSAGSSDEVKQLVDAVGKLMILPSDEQPTVATVTDLAKLSGQPFFAQAQVGDKVLIYQTAAKAILYRPSTNQIIELAPLSADASSLKLSVEIRNGSGKSGVASTWKAKILANSQMNVIKTGNAKGTYPNTLLVDLSKGQKPALVSQLKQLVPGAQVVQSLPTGEANSSADVLLIIGQQ